LSLLKNIIELMWEHLRHLQNGFNKKIAEIIFNHMIILPFISYISKYSLFRFIK
jgi:hypothetical protein